MKQWLDRVTGSVTMYLLVLILLGVIGVVALVLSLAGVLSFQPLELVVSAATAIGVALATSWAAARVVRARAHLISAAITGILVFFIMLPTIDPLGLAGIALASALASASKVLIAVRGRHVLNPAALGTWIVGVIVFTTFVGLSFPVWWVGTAALLPFVAVSAFLVLYRTQRLAMGAVAIGVAVVVGGGLALLRGGTVEDALALTLVSSPIVFFAGFMLSEPLTMPPKRWQQLAEAALVAVLTVVPYSFGPIANTPQFALLVGNILAFAVGQRRAIALTFLGATRMNDSTWELAFQPANRVRFEPGQYMELTLPHSKADLRGSRRTFSISSAPAPDAPITFAITTPDRSSSFKRALIDLAPGTVIRATSVGGDFTLPADRSVPLLLVAGGIGITPFASHLAHARAAGEERDVVVVYGSSVHGALPYADVLEQSGARVVLVAPTAPEPLPAGWTYAGSGRITREVIEQHVTDVAQRRAFVSGPPALVTSFRRVLRSLGAKRVMTDSFSGY